MRLPVRERLPPPLRYPPALQFPVTRPLQRSWYLPLARAQKLLLLLPPSSEPIRSLLPRNLLRVRMRLPAREQFPPPLRYPPALQFPAAHLPPKSPVLLLAQSLPLPQSMWPRMSGQAQKILQKLSRMLHWMPLFPGLHSLLLLRLLSPPLPPFFLLLHFLSNDFLLPAEAVLLSPTQKESPELSSDR